MRDTLLRRVTVRAVAPNVSPPPLVNAAESPMRVLIRNTGGALIFLALTVNDLQRPGQSADRLAPGDELIYVLAPRQGLFALAAGAGGFVTLSANDAVPVTQGVV